jgi:hypothetical protein
VVSAAVVLVLGASPAGGVEPVRIGTHSGVIDTELAADETTGHLFSVLRYDEPVQDCLSVHYSADAGMSWSQPYSRCSAHGLGDHVGAALVDDGYYVAFIDKVAVNSLKVVRMHTSNGGYDGSYGVHTVFTAPVGETISNLSLVSNTVAFDDRLYLFAITEGNLRFFWSDEDGGAGAEPWNEIATGVSDADPWFLDAAFNDGYWLGTTCNPIVAYQADWDLYLWRFHGTTGAEHFVFDGALPVFERPGSIAASHDELEAVYWSYSYEVKSCSSISAGTLPVCRAWEGCDQNFASDMTVTASRVFGAAYAPDNGDCLFRVRDAFGVWRGVATCHDSRPSFQGPLSVAPIPPFGPFSFGVVAVDDDPDDETPYYFPSPVVFIDGFEIGNPSAWSGAAP